MPDKDTTGRASKAGMAGAGAWLLRRLPQRQKAARGADVDQFKPPALRAAELNNALSVLHRVQATHSKAEFMRQILPVYQALLVELSRVMATQAAEQRVIDLMQDTANACRRASQALLPKRRPGTDYRKYEIEYRDALVTVMAVACLQQVQEGDNDSPAQVATRLLPESILSRLQADPMVWEDWLGFFERSPLGGLFEIANGREVTPTENAATHDENPPPTTPASEAGNNGEAAGVEAIPTPRSRASGWSVVDAIKACLDDGTLSHNQPGDLVQVDSDGRTFLQAPAVFEHVKTLLGLPESARNLENRFVRLNINRTTAGKWKRFRGKSLKSESMVQGYVVEDGNVFWDQHAPRGRFVVQNVTARS